MLKRGKNFLIAFIVLALIFVVSVFASFSFQNENLVKNYSAGQTIRGTINISFDAELASAFVTSNFEGDITLLDLLEENNFSSGLEFNCSTSNCIDDYSYGSSTSSFNLGEGEEKIIGLVIVDKPNVQIQEVEFTVQSNAQQSCFKQVNIDVLDNNEHFLTNYNYVGEECFNPNYGCFDPSLEDSDYNLAIIQTTQYCENVTLPPGPAYKLNARVKNSTLGIAPLDMELYNGEGEFLDKCTLPEHTQETQDLGCIVNFSSPYQRDYFACIIAKGPSNYKIRTESEGLKCGTTDPGSSGSSIDYEIFVKNMKFGTLDIDVNDETFTNFNQIELGSLTLSEYVDSYIDDTYNRQCQPSCVIPVRFFGVPQDMSFINVRVEYFSDQTVLESNNFFEIEVDPAEITSDLLDVELSHANFVIPVGSDEDIFELFIDDESVFTVSINIAPSFDFDLTPKSVSFGERVLFVASATANITSSSWDFGDGNTGESDGNSIVHRYLTQGEFEMQVSLTRADGVIGVRTFTITVNSAEDILNETIENYNERILDLGNDINFFPEWVKIEIEKEIDISLLDTALGAIEQDYNIASTDDEFNSVMLDLIALNPPFAINISKKGTLPLIIGIENIDTDYIEKLSVQDVEDEQDLKGRISSWMLDNFDSQITLEQISAFFDEDIDVLLSKFKIETKPKQSITQDKYLILGFGREEIKFKAVYGEKTIVGGTYIILATGQQNQIFEFLITEEIEAEDLGAYISPSVDNLGTFIDFAVCNLNKKCEKSLGESRENCPNDCRPWGWFVFWIIALLFGALVVYIALQEWYKRFYERSLFKNRNDLWNLINFIYNSRRAGFTNGDIRKKLSQVRWKGEKIRYAFRKIDGKRTGMYEIPIFKFLENKKVRKEIAKRQPSRRVDVRFIKGPFKE